MVANQCYIMIKNDSLKEMRFENEWINIIIIYDASSTYTIVLN